MQEPSFVDRIKHIESRGRRFGSDGKILQGPQTRYGTAKGEMQVLDGTARDPGYGVAPAKDGSPEELARVGTQYAEALLSHFKGDEAKAGAAYNYGPGNVQKLLAKHGDNWMAYLPKETKNYVASLGSGGGQVPGAALAATAPLPAAGAPMAPVVVAENQVPSEPGPVPLPPEVLAALTNQAALMAMPSADQDAWQAFLRTMPQQRRPVEVADLDFAGVRPAPVMAAAQPMQNLRPNFEAFSSWKGRVA